VLAAIAALAAIAVAPGAAAAQTPGSGPGGPALTTPRDYADPPAGWRLAGREAIAAARRVPQVREELARTPGATYLRAYLAAPRDDGRRRWQVSWFARGEPDAQEVVQVHVDDATGEVLEAWTGIQVSWTMARGYPGAFGRRVNAPYVWIGFCLLFVLPFARPPLRLVHLDLAVLLSFGVGYALFNDARIGASVALVYPPLLYLLARATWIAWYRRDPPPRTWMSTDLLVFAIVFVIGFRIGLNVTSSNVVDVGYSGVIGADRILGGEALYGAFPPDNERGDTYGPAAYVAYVPFVALFGWSGAWDSLPAAHAAAIVFDLALAGGLFALGRRMGGAHTGALLAYAWLTFPFSLLVLNSNANDALVGALLVGVLLVSARPAARGAVAALAGLTKLAPLALAPLFARPGTRRFALAFAATAVAVTVPAVVGGGLGELAGRTLGFQADRDSPFSLWGYHGLELGQAAVQWGAVAFALAVAVVPRPRDLVATAALAAAVLIAVQLSAWHWFYLYLAWFVPLLLVALLAPRQAAGRSTGSIAPARRRPSPRTTTAISQGSSSAES
jgi:hypothetical protein